jgi:hypothetical protein
MHPEWVVGFGVRFGDGCYAFRRRLVYWEVVDWVVYGMMELMDKRIKSAMRIDLRITMSLKMNDS